MTAANAESVCVCGHGSGHHDDEPYGCWHCDCESWDRAAESSLLVRPATDDERDRFCLETSMKVRQPRGATWTEWNHAARETMAREMREGRVVVGVEDDVIVGFAYYSRYVLRMVYVKRDLRGFGYGLELLGANAGGMLYPLRPNACFRRWARAKKLIWTEVP